LAFLRRLDFPDFVERGERVGGLRFAESCGSVIIRFQGLNFDGKLIERSVGCLLVQPKLFQLLGESDAHLAYVLVMDAGSLPGSEC